MKDSIIIIGLDVHEQTIVAAVLPPGRERVTESITIENHPKVIEKLVKRLGSNGALQFVYEAGPCGYEVHRQISEMGYPCSVIAPSLTPVRPGDRVKTDRRDAEKLARLYRARELTEIRVPTREEGRWTRSDAVGVDRRDHLFTDLSGSAIRGLFVIDTPRRLPACPDLAVTVPKEGRAFVQIHCDTGLR